MKQLPVAFLLILTFFLSCKKSGTIQKESYPLLTSKSWKLYQRDSAILDVNNNVIQFNTNLVTDCRNNEVLTFLTESKMTKLIVCKLPSPQLWNGVWEINSDSTLTYIFNAGTDFPIINRPKIQKLTSDSLNLVYLTGYFVTNGQTKYIPTVFRYIH